MERPPRVEGGGERLVARSLPAGVLVEAADLEFGVARVGVASMADSCRGKVLGGAV